MQLEEVQQLLEGLAAQRRARARVALVAAVELAPEVAAVVDAPAAVAAAAAAPRALVQRREEGLRRGHEALRRRGDVVEAADAVQPEGRLRRRRRELERPEERLAEGEGQLAQALGRRVAADAARPEPRAVQELPGQHLRDVVGRARRERAPDLQRELAHGHEGRAVGRVGAGVLIKARERVLHEGDAREGLARLLRARAFAGDVAREGRVAPPQRVRLDGLVAARVNP